MNIPELWKLKTIGKTDPSHTLPTEEEFPRDIFIKEIGRNCQGHYILGLPWINGKWETPSNRHMDERILISSTKNLKLVKRFQEYANVFC